MTQETQTTPACLVEKLFKVVEDVQFIAKENYNSHGKFAYVSHDDVMHHFRPILQAHRILAIPRVVRTEFDNCLTTAWVEIEFIDVDNPADRLTVPGFGQGYDSQDKGAGKAVSYAVKYIFLKTFMTETGDDSDHDDSQAQPAAPAASAPAARPAQRQQRPAGRQQPGNRRQAAAPQRPQREPAAVAAGAKADPTALQGQYSGIAPPERTSIGDFGTYIKYRDRYSAGDDPTEIALDAEEDTTLSQADAELIINCALSGHFIRQKKAA